jgi:glycosyltransferase involved in cell wall biosynthesis
MAAYNEADIIVRSIEKLLAQRIEVYLIDNWSDDGSYEVIAEQLGSKLIGLERFPKTGPAEHFDLHSLLLRKEELAKTLQADWFINCDADEVRSSPWPGVSLRDAIYFVDRKGFNAIDHTIAEFHPVDIGFQQGVDFEDYFKWFSFASHGTQIKTWKNTGQPVLLAASGGHNVWFEGRCIYPYKFLVKHYPIRSQEHGVRKVFRERRSRYHPAEKAIGWHSHYDNIHENYNFLKSTAALIRFDVNHFYGNYLIERLTGIPSLPQMAVESTDESG